MASTAKQRRLARRLRQLRTQAGKTIEDAASRLGCKHPKISKIENNQAGVKPEEVRALCQLYGASDHTTESMVALARNAKAPDEREHVTFYAWQHRDKYRISPVDCPAALDPGLPDLKLDLDTPADLERLRILCAGETIDVPAERIVALGLPIDARVSAGARLPWLDELEIAAWVAAALLLALGGGLLASGVRRRPRPSSPAGSAWGA